MPRKTEKGGEMMANGDQLDTLDRVVDSAGKIAVLIGAIVFTFEVVIPLFQSLI